MRRGRLSVLYVIRMKRFPYVSHVTSNGRLKMLILEMYLVGTDGFKGFRCICRKECITEVI
jgi:hypothetical protein